MQDSNNSGKMIGSLLLGAAIGAALGILFAPDKGSETRKKIVGKTDDLTDAINEKLNDFMSEIQKELDVVKHQANEMMHK